MSEEFKLSDYHSRSTLSEFDAYSDFVISTSVFPADKGVEYCTLKLNGEAGEVAEKIGKAIRKGVPVKPSEVAAELGDVLWYVAALANEFGYTLGDIADSNVKKLLDRKERGVIIGEGDNR